MKSKLLRNTDGRREWAMIFEAGDEVMAELNRFAISQQLTGAHFTGIGAFANVTIAWFDLQKRSYQPVAINDQVEVLSLLGDVAEAEGKLFRACPYLCSQARRKRARRASATGPRAAHLGTDRDRIACSSAQIFST